jgi:hypothetical protein
LWPVLRYSEKNETEHFYSQVMAASTRLLPVQPSGVLMAAGLTGGVSASVLAPLLFRAGVVVQLPVIFHCFFEEV